MLLLPLIPLLSNRFITRVAVFTSLQLNPNQVSIFFLCKYYTVATRRFYTTILVFFFLCVEMTKGDDAVMRRRNKAKIKKLNNKNTSSNVSARVAAVIAAKKRRKSGKRRQCQVLYFSFCLYIYIYKEIYRAMLVHRTHFDSCPFLLFL